MSFYDAAAQRLTKKPGYEHWGILDLHGAGNLVIGLDAYYIHSILCSSHRSDV